MFRLLRRACVLVLLAAPALAGPTTYTLDPGASTVGFETDFGPDRITGRMPVARAVLVLDFDRAAGSSVEVTLDVAHAAASLPFAAQAMKGPKVLDAGRHPTMEFRSTTVRAAGEGAKVDGRLTIRGVTRPVTLDAAIFRQAGQPPGDLSRLTVRLTGRVLRSDFGATGWADLVGDEVRITITARIAAAG